MDSLSNNNFYKNYEILKLIFCSLSNPVSFTSKPKIAKQLHSSLSRDLVSLYTSRTLFSLQSHSHSPTTLVDDNDDNSAIRCIHRIDFQFLPFVSASISFTDFHISLFLQFSLAIFFWLMISRVLDNQI
jgi:hypothetical protein